MIHRRTCSRPAVALALALFASSVAAQTTSELIIDHTDGYFYLTQDGKATTPDGLIINKSANSIRLRRKGPITIRIKNSNRLLFDYTVTGEETRERSETEALEAFAKALQGFVTGLGAGVATTTKLGDCELTKDHDIFKYLDTAAALGAFTNERKRLATKSFNDPDAVRREIGAWSLDKKKTDIETLQPKLLKYQKKFSGLLLADQPTADEKKCYTLVDQLVSQASEVTKLVSELVDFRSRAQGVGKRLTIKNYAIDEKSDQIFKVSVKRKDELWPAGEIYDGIEGEIPLEIGVKRRMKINVAPAVLYSRVRDPEFEAVEKEGQFVVTKTSDSRKEVDLAALLELSPTAWDFSTVQFSIHLGVSPEKDPGVFLGAGISGLSVFTFGAGIAYQEVQKLGPGLILDQVIASKDLLKLDDEFAEGLYFYVSVTLPKKAN